MLRETADGPTRPEEIPHVERRLGLALGTGAAVLFGTSYVATKLALVAFSPLAVGAWRGIGAFLLLLAFAAARRGPGAGLAALRGIGRSELARLVALGFLGGPGLIIGLNLAVASAGAAIASFVAGLYAVLAAVLAPPLLGERLGARAVIGFAVALVGTGLLAELEMGGAPLAGIAAGVGGAVSYALYLVLSRRWGTRPGDVTTGPRVIAVMFAMTALVLIPLDLAAEAGTIVPSVGDPVAFGAVAWLVLGPSFLSNVMLQGSVRRVPARVTAALLLLNPLTATALAVALLGERLTTLQLLGGALVLAAIAIANGLVGLPRRPSEGSRSRSLALGVLVVAGIALTQLVGLVQPADSLGRPADARPAALPAPPPTATVPPTAVAAAGLVRADTLGLVASGSRRAAPLGESFPVDPAASTEGSGHAGTTLDPRRPRGRGATAFPGIDPKPSVAPVDAAPRATPRPIPPLPEALDGYVWPLSRGRLTTDFGFVDGASWVVEGRQFHDGIDIASHCGAPIVAAHDGVVLAAGRRFDRYLGWRGDLGAYEARLTKRSLWGRLPITVVIDDDNGYRSVYTHFSRITVRAGDRVGAGEVIGYEGRTGYASGCHLHYGIFSPWETRAIDLRPDFAKRLRLPASVDARIDPFRVLPPMPSRITLGWNVEARPEPPRRAALTSRKVAQDSATMSWILR